MSIVEINKRYSNLAQSDCCLSCGGAINYAEAKEGEICVDLGSGRGTDAIRMAELVGKNGFVYGIDIADGMIEKARNTAQKTGITNISFIRSELETLNIPNETADLVISNCTLNHAANKQAVWNEIARILKPGGRFVVSDIYATAPIPEKYKNDPQAVAECWAGAITRSEYLTVLEHAGFKNINIIEESLPYKKGEAMVASWTIAAVKQKTSCCCNN